MSLISQILGQKLIILSASVALLLLVLALGLVLYGRLRARNAKRARQRAQQAQARSDEAAAVASESTAALNPDSPEQATATTTAQPVPTAQAVQGAQPAGTAAAGSPATQISTEQPEAGTQVANMMQDMLSSVFTDEDVLARYEVLLRGIDNIDVVDLSALCSEIAGQLGASGRPAAIRKEAP